MFKNILSVVSTFFRSLPQRLRGLTTRDIVEFFENLYGKGKQLVETARHTYYRLVIMNNDTFEEVGSYKLSLMNLYVMISSAFVATAMLVTCLIIFTPLKRYIPGYGGSASGRSVLDLTDKVEELEEKVKANDTYYKNMKRWLTDDVIREKDIPKTEAKMVDNELIPASDDDAGLRRDVATGNVVNTEDDGVKSLPMKGNKGEKLEQMSLISPISGEVSKPFKMEGQHFGIDIVAPKNTAIKSIADGHVVSADWTLETGNTISVQHPNGVISFYKHNSMNLKKVGDRVRGGEAIAIIGNTGEQTTGPHLHFELWYNGKAVNPQEYMRF